MAGGIIQSLELVQVDCHDRRGPAQMVGFLERGAQAQSEFISIDEPGERIMHRPVL